MQGVLPMMRIGGDRTLTPDYPGITDAPDLGAWDPPFPVDLSKVRPQDEAYWDQWRGAPKAFVPLDTGQRLWGSRFGNISSIRFALRDADAVAAAVRAQMNSQVVVRPVRQEAVAAAEGTTDFGEYFLYFSAFLVASALLIAYLFFALSIEQRAREVGLLAAVGFTTRQVRRVFLREAVIITAAGVVVGVAGAVGYAALIMHGLRTWWVDAVGTTALTLHVDPAALIAGAMGANAAALLALWLGTKSLAKRSPRSLLLGATPDPPTRNTRTTAGLGIALAIVAAALIAAARGGMLDATGGFFGAGGALLVSGLLLSRARLLAGADAGECPATRRPRVDAGAEPHGVASDPNGPHPLAHRVRHLRARQRRRLPAGRRRDVARANGRHRRVRPDGRGGRAVDARPEHARRPRGDGPRCRRHTGRHPRDTGATAARR